jgi:hypothetical protein
VNFSFKLVGPGKPDQTPTKTINVILKLCYFKTKLSLSFCDREGVMLTKKILSI